MFEPVGWEEGFILSVFLRHTFSETTIWAPETDETTRHQSWGCLEFENCCLGENCHLFIVLRCILIVSLLHILYTNLHLHSHFQHIINFAAILIFLYCRTGQTPHETPFYSSSSATLADAIPSPGHSSSFPLRYVSSSKHVP